MGVFCRCKGKDYGDTIMKGGENRYKRVGLIEHGYKRRILLVPGVDVWRSIEFLVAV